MNKALKFLIVVVLGGVGLAVLLLRESPDSRVTALEKRIEEMEQRPPTTRVERRFVVGWPSQQNDRESGAVLPSPDQDENSNLAEMNEEEKVEATPFTEEAAREEAALDHAALQADFEKQGGGDAAAPVTGASIYEAFGRLREPSNLVKAECHSRTCRIEADFDSKESYNQAFEQLFLGKSPLIEHGGVRSPMPLEGEDGSQQAVMFVSVYPPNG